MAYKIQVLTLQNTNLTFSVQSYEVLEGDMISFLDYVSGEKKYFHASRVEIKEISDEEYQDQVNKKSNPHNKNGGWR